MEGSTATGLHNAHIECPFTAGSIQLAGIALCDNCFSRLPFGARKGVPGWRPPTACDACGLPLASLLGKPVRLDDGRWTIRCDCGEPLRGSHRRGALFGTWAFVGALPSVELNVGDGLVPEAVRSSDDLGATWRSTVMNGLDVADLVTWRSGTINCLEFSDGSAHRFLLHFRRENPATWVAYGGAGVDGAGMLLWAPLMRDSELERRIAAMLDRAIRWRQSALAGGKKEVVEPLRALGNFYAYLC
ncbi:hypothetical protein WME79_25590 [Sorangium sp. So ce726]|uniref:hypothetical protein n=1 Tax=Sorangium sp. So ce726 TaxID=3133319 RepID=UPI003F63EFFA